MPLAPLLKEVSENFAYERAKPFSENALAIKIRHDLKEAAKSKIIYRKDQYIIKGSAGAGNWAAVPWLGFFDPIITESAQQGFYVVYLFNIQTGEVFLSLNQGTTAAQREYGARYTDVLRRKAQDIRDRLSDKLPDFSVTEISLGSPAPLPIGYEAGHALGAKYDCKSLSEEQLTEDLHLLLDVYQTLISRGGLLPTEVMMDTTGAHTLEECRNYTLSLRIERSKKVRRSVLSCVEPICQACGLNPFIDYGYSGSVEKVPLDVHHLKPLFELAEGVTTRYRVPDDFAVLCPTCHRVAHQMEDPGNIGELKRHIRFAHMREVL